MCAIKKLNSLKFAEWQTSNLQLSLFLDRISEKILSKIDDSLAGSLSFLGHVNSNDFIIEEAKCNRLSI